MSMDQAKADRLAWVRRNAASLITDEAIRLAAIDMKQVGLFAPSTATVDIRTSIRRMLEIVQHTELAAERAVIEAAEKWRDAPTQDNAVELGQKIDHLRRVREGK